MVGCGILKADSRDLYTVLRRVISWNATSCRSRNRSRLIDRLWWLENNGVLCNMKPALKLFIGAATMEPLWEYNSIYPSSFFPCNHLVDAHSLA